ncbi:MAG: alpha-galactosidase [Ruminococcus sp.]|nr:alpha-galactosidase [Ruminococcus sp.]
MSKRICYFENGIYLVFEIDDDNEIKLVHFSPSPLRDEDLESFCKEKGYALFDSTKSFRPVEINISGLDRPLERHGNKYIITAPGYRMKFKGINDTANQQGRLIEVSCFDEPTGIETVSHYQFYNGVSVCRVWTTVRNNGDKPRTLEYVSSFNLNGIEKEGVLPQDKKMRVWVCHNSWQKEMCWQSYTLPQLGIPQTQPKEFQHSSKVFALNNVGNWSTKEYIPMGVIENTETGSALIWQIEHNGSWHAEISDQEGHLYLQLSGPTEIESHFTKVLKPGDEFESVTAAVGVSERTNMPAFDNAVAELTKYRRLIRRRNKDNERLAVIFNDYMNCLWGDPTEEKEYPLIDAAAAAGCEYFCIDAGWYADGKWWDEVGEWVVSKKRFPNGLRPVTDYIRSKGMIPGVWLELEAMGINCPLLKTKCDDSWFFMRHGERVYDRSRYQLDYRSPAVREFADSVIDRLVNEYGIGYIKMDYNIEPGIGTELNADSVGDGLLGHERAYIEWLGGVFKRHPSLIIENCSSGGLRIDYKMLSLYSIQSTSDQDDYKRYCTIAANSPAALTPEQSAIWSYPKTDGDREEVVFNMVNAMLLRIHQSGHLAYISEESGALVKEAIRLYRQIRRDIRTAVPFWPIGMSQFDDDFTALGLRNEDDSAYIAVWRREGGRDEVRLPVGFMGALDIKSVRAECIYPSFCEEGAGFDNQTHELIAHLPQKYTARLYKLTPVRGE